MWVGGIGLLYVCTFAVLVQALEEELVLADGPAARVPIAVGPTAAVAGLLAACRGGGRRRRKGLLFAVGVVGGDGGRRRRREGEVGKHDAWRGRGDEGGGLRGRGRRTTRVHGLGLVRGVRGRGDEGQEGDHDVVTHLLFGGVWRSRGFWSLWIEEEELSPSCLEGGGTRGLREVEAAGPYVCPLGRFTLWRRGEMGGWVGGRVGLARGAGGMWEC